MNSTQPHKSILILSPDPAFRAVFRDNVLLHGFRIQESSNENETFSLIEKEGFDIVFLDLACSVKTEIDLVNLIKSRTPYCEIVIVASIECLDEATLALRNGASFYLIKPIERANLNTILGKLSLKLERHTQYMDLERHLLEETVSGSEAMRKILKLSLKIAPTSSTVLITGESGTGKEFFARIIHRMSGRTDGPFLPVNCGALPEHLFESEMFGHKKGAFTGADRDKTGLAEEANLGTLFLDEVGELSPTAQVKLLRFLQDRSVRRVGETSSRVVNVRVIAATNKDLFRLVSERKFREDLYYRLNVFHLALPPLRDRRGTIPHLLKLLIHKNNIALGKQVERVSKETEAILARYDYPGNIRELENIIEHGMALSTGSELKAEDLPEFISRNQPRLMAPEDVSVPAREFLTLSEVERSHIMHVLDLTGSNYSEAAKKLGISRSTLWRKLKEYGIGGMGL